MYKLPFGHDLGPAKIVFGSAIEQAARAAPVLRHGTNENKDLRHILLMLVRWISLSLELRRRERS